MPRRRLVLALLGCSGLVFSSILAGCNKSVDPNVRSSEEARKNFRGENMPPEMRSFPTKEQIESAKKSAAERKYK